MSWRNSVLGVALSVACFFTGIASAPEEPMDLQLASQYFMEAQFISNGDNGRLWGLKLYGPMLFVEPDSRMVVANQADNEGRLSQKGTVFIGKLPQDVPTANTATTWAGVKWTMIVWPLPTTFVGRARLMAHELFHRVQDDLGLPAQNPQNSHLDSLDGRLWLQLEWRALRQALLHDGEERRRAAADALVFRAYRQQLFEKAAAEEDALEMNEGLAEYTGVKLRGTSEAETVDWMAKRLASAHGRPSFVRSFAYETGPAYGLLLDAIASDWRKNLKTTKDLSKLLQDSLALKLPDNLKEEVEKRLQRYDGEALRKAEIEREETRRRLVAEYRARLVEGPVLEIPLGKDMRYSFNPNNLVPLDDRTCLP